MKKTDRPPVLEYDEERYAREIKTHLCYRCVKMASYDILKNRIIFMGCESKETGYPRVECKFFEPLKNGKRKNPNTKRL